MIHAFGVFIALLFREIYRFSEGWVVPASILFLAIIFGYGISYMHRKGIKLPVITRVIDSSEREKDKGFPGRGALRFFTGAFLTILIFRNYPEIVVSAIIVLALGDSASTLVGISFGRHKIFYNKEKSVEGSIAGFGAAFIGLSLLSPFPPLVNAIASFIGILMESLPLGIDDNLTVPVITGLTVWTLTAAIVI